MKQELMSMTEIRKYLGVVRQRAYQITRQPGFPEPIAKLGRLEIWDGDEVRAWQADREASGRVKAEPKEA